MYREKMEKKFIFDCGALEEDDEKEEKHGTLQTVWDEDEKRCAQKSEKRFGVDRRRNGGCKPVQFTIWLFIIYTHARELFQAKRGKMLQSLFFFIYIFLFCEKILW